MDQWCSLYLTVVIVGIDMVLVKGYSQVRSDGVDVDRLQLPSFEACLLIVRQRHVPVVRVQSYSAEIRIPDYI